MSPSPHFLDLSKTWMASSLLLFSISPHGVVSLLLQMQCLIPIPCCSHHSEAFWASKTFLGATVSALSWENHSEMAHGRVRQQSLILHLPFFPRMLDMGNIISAWENPGRKVEGVSWGVGGTKQLVPPDTTVVAVPWLCLAAGHSLCPSAPRGAGRLWHTALWTWGYLGLDNRSAVGFLGPDLRAVQHLFKTERAARGECFWKLPGVGVMGEVFALGFHHLPSAWKPFQCLFKGIPN